MSRSAQNFIIENRGSGPLTLHYHVVTQKADPKAGTEEVKEVRSLELGDPYDARKGTDPGAHPRQTVPVATWNAVMQEHPEHIEALVADDKLSVHRG